MRKMHAEMKLMEERLLRKVEESLADVRREMNQNDSALSRAIMPLMQCISQEQIELRSTLKPVEESLADVRDEMKQRDLKLSSAIMPLMQCIAHEQIELRETFKQLQDAEFDVKPCKHSLPHDSDFVPKDLEELGRELQQECAAQAEHDFAMYDDIKASRDEVARLTKDICPRVIEVTPGVAGNACDVKHKYDGPDLMLQWPDQPFAGIPYSNKMSSNPGETKWLASQMWSYSNLGGADSTLFAHSGARLNVRSMKHGLNCRSCPVLPPLK
jgi:hypothetical protein